MEKIFQFVLEKLREFSLNILHFLGWCHTMTPCCRSIFFLKADRLSSFGMMLQYRYIFRSKKVDFPRLNIFDIISFIEGSEIT